MELAIAHNIQYVTNIEALTVLCSVVEHAKSGMSKKELRGETGDVVVLLDFYAFFYTHSRVRRAILRKNN